MAVKKPKKQSVKLVQPKKGKKPSCVTADTPLNRRQRVFIEEYLKDFNAKRAAIKAGYSSKTAAVIGSQNLIKLNIAAAIKKKLSERTEIAELSAQDLLSQIKSISTSDIRDFIKFGPGYTTLSDSAKLTPEQAMCISEVVETVGENGSQVKLKLHDKLKAIDMGMKYLGLYAPEKRELSGKLTVETGVRRVGDED